MMNKDKNKQYGWLRFIADTIHSLIWPIVVVFLLFMFKEQLSGLLQRARSFEIAGTRSEFVDYGNAFDYLGNMVADLAKASDEQKKQQILQDVLKLTGLYRELHPKALALLIDIGKGLRKSSTWPTEPDYLLQLSDKGLVSLSPPATKPNDITNDTSASLTMKGAQFLSTLGYAPKFLMFEENH